VNHAERKGLRLTACERARVLARSRSGALAVRRERVPAREREELEI
jgi:hypothetical protein